MFVSYKNCIAFLFLPVKYKSFNLYPFRSIYGVIRNVAKTKDFVVLDVFVVSDIVRN